MNNNFRLKQKNCDYNNLNQFAFLLKLKLICFVCFIFDKSITQVIENVINFSSEIHLIIIGNGKQSILNNFFYLKPS